MNNQLLKVQDQIVEETIEESIVETEQQIQTRLEKSKDSQFSQEQSPEDQEDIEDNALIDKEDDSQFQEDQDKIIDEQMKYQMKKQSMKAMMSDNQHEKDIENQPDMFQQYRKKQKKQLSKKLFNNTEAEGDKSFQENIQYQQSKMDEFDVQTLDNLPEVFDINKNELNSFLSDKQTFSQMNSNMEVTHMNQSQILKKADQNFDLIQNTLTNNQNFQELPEIPQQMLLSVLDLLQNYQQQDQKNTETHVNNLQVSQKIVQDLFNIDSKKGFQYNNRSLIYLQDRLEKDLYPVEQFIQKSQTEIDENEHKEKLVKILYNKQIEYETYTHLEQQEILRMQRKRLEKLAKDKELKDELEQMQVKQVEQKKQKKDMKKYLANKQMI